MFVLKKWHGKRALKHSTLNRDRNMKGKSCSLVWLWDRVFNGRLSYSAINFRCLKRKDVITTVGGALVQTNPIIPLHCYLYSILKIWLCIRTHLVMHFLFPVCPGCPANTETCIQRGCALVDNDTYHLYVVPKEQNCTDRTVNSGTTFLQGTLSLLSRGKKINPKRNSQGISPRPVTSNLITDISV